jgi:tetratricopeptide (TPR) repeat protein
MIRISLVAFLFAALTLNLSTSTATAQQSKLGTVDFPNSGSKEAQVHFIRGLAALHSFWYEEALEAFRESTKVDPEFTMGYWGEAMAHNHPLWSQQETEAARTVLKNAKESSGLTPRERAFLNAVKILYGEGSKAERDNAYARAMEKIYQDYPDDLEAAAFYSLSLLGTVRPGERGFSRQMKAGAIALDVYKKNPNHPGAAHYVIHSFDDPEHAILALPAAYRYAEIAPEAHHARHMPSHIFLQLGMWSEAARSNESSWSVSDEWVKRKSLSITLRDYHSLTWLTYVYVQQGRYSKAEGLLALLRNAIKEKNDPRMRRAYFEMATMFLIETERWDSLGAILDPPELKLAAQQESGGSSGQHSHGAAPATSGPTSAATPQRPASAYGQGPSPRIGFARGLAAVGRGDLEAAAAQVANLAANRKQATESGNPYQAKQVEIMELALSAMVSSKKGNSDNAIELIKKAASLEESLSPPSGPPDVIKPAHEIFGEILARAGRHKEASEQFAVSLQRQPNRARSLLGAARAAAASGDKEGAKAAYSTLARIWQQADQKLEEAREVGSAAKEK